MKKALLFLLLIVPILAWGQDFDSTVDFSLQLSILSEPDAARRAGEDGRFAILEGVTGPVIQIDGEAWLRIIGGEWIGTKEVRAYTCLIRVEETRWHRAFPAEVIDRTDSEYVLSGSRILTAVSVLGWNDDKDEPIAEMVDYRILK